MKLLIAAPDTLGAIVCSTALLRCINKGLADSEIHYWVAPQWAAAVARHPAIARLYVQDDDPYKLPFTAFDAVIDLRADRQLRHWAKRAGIRYMGINASFLVSFLSEHFGLMNSAANMPVAARFFDAAKPLQVYDDGLGASYILAPEDSIKPSDLPTSHSAGYLVLVVADYDYDVAVPETVLAALCRALTLPVVLVNSRGNHKIAEAMCAIDPIKIYNACGKFTLNETADIIQKSKLVVSTETGLMQVAAAFQKPMVVLRSSERPSPYFPPYYGHFNTGSIKKRYAAWVWPSEEEMHTYKDLKAKKQQEQEPWIMAVMDLIQKMLRHQVDQPL